MGIYDMRMGGDGLGQRLNQIMHENVSEHDILNHLDHYFEVYKAFRREAEKFGDFFQRYYLNFSE